MATFSDGTDTPPYSHSNEFRPIRGNRHSRNENFRDNNQYNTGYQGTSQYYDSPDQYYGYTHNIPAYNSDIRRYPQGYHERYYEGEGRRDYSPGRDKRGRGGRGKRGTGRGGRGQKDYNFVPVREGDYGYAPETNWELDQYSAPWRDKENRGRKNQYGNTTNYSYSDQKSSRGKPYVGDNPTHHNYTSPTHHNYNSPTQHNYDSPTHHNYNNPTHHNYNNPTQHNYNNPTHHNYNNPTHHNYNNPTHHNYNNPTQHNYNNHNWERREVAEWRVAEKIKGATAQTEELTQQIVQLTYECVVCCEIVRHAQSVWSCQECFQIFHLSCVAKWATAPNSLADVDHPEKGWKCPTCRHSHIQVPEKYMCFCGEVQNPVWKRGELPHSCTEICGKCLNTDQERSLCQHKCKQLCHPGPCPPCAAMVQVSCPCKKATMEMRCNMAVNVPPCDDVCEKPLSCGRHCCQQQCHHGECESCCFAFFQTCYCNKSKRKVLCADLEVGTSIEDGEKIEFSCGQPCSRQISCGNHLCEKACHYDDCGGCHLAPEFITTCPCGAYPLKKLLSKGEERTSCLDPIPVCHSTCDKVLLCSKPDYPKTHRCELKCHTEDCNICDRQQLVQCRCAKSRVFVPCKDLRAGKPDQLPKCEKLCNKKMECGKHRCQNKCCINSFHPCNIICNKRLHCGHKCMEICHTHRCPPCPNTSFDELYCYCGKEVVFPPIPCGTLPPICKELCSRNHPCDHPPRHNCHSEKTCPPCAELIEKICMCGKESLCNVPCYQKDPSCGRTCGKLLRCGVHHCNKLCHRGHCQTEKDTCVQKCLHARKLCGHTCAVPCHGKSTCPQTLCSVWVTVKCNCGRKSSQMLCPFGSENPDIQRRIKEKGLSGVVSSLLSGKKVDIGKYMELKNLENLECDDDCQKEDWKRKLADAFGVDTSSQSDQAIREMYNPFLKEQAKLEPAFTSQLEEQIKKLVQTAYASQSKCQQHVFRPMKGNHRRTIHELASYYNCQTWSLDPEPQRQVVVLANKASVIPSTSLSDLVHGSKKLKKPLQPLS